MARNKTLHLDEESKKFLGVCAGLAKYLGVEPWSVRVVYLGGLFFAGWILVPIYFIAWWLMDDRSESIRHSLTDNLAVKHFRTVDYRKKIYRNTRDAKWAGVCAGIADYLEVNVFAIRMLFMLLFFSTAGFSLTFYFAAWIVLDKAPDEYYLGYTEKDSSRPRANENVDEVTASKFETSASAFTMGKRKKDKVHQEHLKEELHSKRKEIKFCARKFSSLQNRLVRMEAYITSSKFTLHKEFKDIS